jgi:hypothetical protein
MRKEPTGGMHHARETKCPEHQTDQMQAQIDDAATARLYGVVKPGFIGTIGV